MNPTQPPRSGPSKFKRGELVIPVRSTFNFDSDTANKYIGRVGEVFFASPIIPACNIKFGPGEHAAFWDEDLEYPFIEACKEALR